MVVLLELVDLCNSINSCTENHTGVRAATRYTSPKKEKTLVNMKSFLEACLVELWPVALLPLLPSVPLISSFSSAWGGFSATFCIYLWHFKSIFVSTALS